jgi:outer membrane protein TolC
MIDVLQAQVAEAEAQLAVARADAAVQNASAGLNLLLNLPLDERFALTNVLERRHPSGTLDLAIARAQRERPELADLRARMDVARAALELARSGGRPNVVLGGAYDLGGSPSAATGGWSVALSATLSLSDGGLTREHVREAEARLAQLRLLEADRRRVVELEVRQAWLALVQAEAEIAAASAGTVQAREAARLADLRYQGGVGTSLEIISAQAALSRAEAAMVQALFSHSLARGLMDLAVGGALE